MGTRLRQRPGRILLTKQRSAMASAAAALPVALRWLQQARGSYKILRSKTLSEFLINRGEQSDGLGPPVGRDPVRGKISGDTQLEGHCPDCARFGERLL